MKQATLPTLGQKLAGVHTRMSPPLCFLCYRFSVPAFHSLWSLTFLLLPHYVVLCIHPSTSHPFVLLICHAVMRHSCSELVVSSPTSHLDSELPNISQMRICILRLPVSDGDEGICQKAQNHPFSWKTFPFICLFASFIKSSLDHCVSLWGFNIQRGLGRHC